MGGRKNVETETFDVQKRVEEAKQMFLDPDQSIHKNA